MSKQSAEQLRLISISALGQHMYSPTHIQVRLHTYEHACSNAHTHGRHTQAIKIKNGKKILLSGKTFNAHKTPQL